MDRRPSLSLLAAAVLAALGSPAIGQETPAPPLTWPGTTAGTIAKAWFDTIADGGDDAIVAFEARWRSAEKLAEKSAADRVENWQGMRRQIGNLTPVRVLATEPASIAVLARSDVVPVPLRVQLDLTDDSPSRLRGLSIRPFVENQTPLGPYRDFESLSDLLERVVADARVPAVAAAVVEGGAIVDAGVAGHRVAGEEAPCEIDDRFHLGSITKSMTATVIGGLVAEGVLRWDAPLAELLPGIDMLDAYREVTLAHLVRHRAGVRQYLTMDDSLEAELMARAEGEVAQRAFFVARVLGEEPLGTPGEHYAYSNAGYTIAGHVAEVATETPWAELLRKRLFAPLGMATADIGWPATAARRGQPRGHDGSPGSRRALGFGEYQVGPFFAPAGDVCCSARDLARYASAHLAALRGEEGPLAADVVRTLHAPGFDGSTYAAGWILAQQEGERVHWHAGSGGTFYAHVELHPDANRAVVVMTNVGFEGEAIAKAVVDAYVARWKGE